MDRQPIISAKDVEITFSLRGKKLNAIRKCSLDLYDGETLPSWASPAGQAVFSQDLRGYAGCQRKITGGSIMYEGRDMTKFTEKDWLGVRGKKIAMVMQDPMTSLNPLKKIGKQIQESIEHHQGLKGAEAKKAAIEMLAKVGIPDPERRYEQYPHEFSGGMRQRVVIAIAAACRPQILICDEPTTALDVTIQAQILQLIRDLQKELGMSVIYITHDLGVVANVADRVAVMYAGQIVEYGTVEEIFYDAWHPYTWALLPWHSGKTLFYGKDIHTLKPKDVWSTISYIPQSRGFAFCLHRSGNGSAGAQCASRNLSATRQRGNRNGGSHDGTSWDHPSCQQGLQPDERR